MVGEIVHINPQHNQKCFFGSNVNVQINSRKNDNGSHTIQFQIQTIDRRNYINKSFIVPREKGDIHCEVYEGEVIFTIDGKKLPITDEIQGVQELIEWSNNKLLDKGEVERFTNVSDEVVEIMNNSNIVQIGAA